MGKTALTVTVIFLVSLAEYGVVTAVIDDLSHIKFWVAMFFDSASMTFPFICLGVYSHLSFLLVHGPGSPRRHGRMSRRRRLEFLVHDPFRHGGALCIFGGATHCILQAQVGRIRNVQAPRVHAG